MPLWAWKEYLKHIRLDLLVLKGATDQQQIANTGKRYVHFQVNK